MTSRLQSPGAELESEPARNEARPLLAIVPARGGSKEVARKNMRFLGDRPLLAHTAEAVAEASVAARLIVSSDSEDVLTWADLHGFECRERPPELATDDATISDVAAHVADELDWQGDVGVFQPTSPFRSVHSIRSAVETFRESDLDSMSSCVRERHNFWLDENGDLANARPLFTERVNRQFASHDVLRENGSIQLVRAATLRATRQMVSERHRLFETPPEESLDIDTNDDLVVARRRYEQGTVVFRLRANRKVGSGHIYNCLQLADELADQRTVFLLRECDPFVGALIAEHGYQWRTETDLSRNLRELAGPRGNLIVNDVLDTTEEEVLAQRAAGFRVVNLEDLGPGARLADWVVNALYPIQSESNGHALNGHVAYGAEYTTLRGEFFHLPRKPVQPTPRRVLVTFGGTDPARLGVRCARLLSGRIDAEVRVVIGPGATDQGFPEGVEVRRHVRSMAAEMMAADLIVTSAGRTVYEAAAVGTPVAVLAQGARDATHAHLTFDTGVVFLGIGPLVDDEHVVAVVDRLLGDRTLREELSERLRRSVDPWGAARIAHRIRAFLRGL
jgi:CMP-N-acetylneuraminic acid synthetase/spore coat polysaccharide biosynthesis predicted glycosyltransferase SpsG